VYIFMLLVLHVVIFAFVLRRSYVRSIIVVVVVVVTLVFYITHFPISLLPHVHLSSPTSSTLHI